MLHPDLASHCDCIVCRRLKSLLLTVPHLIDGLLIPHCKQKRNLQRRTVNINHTWALNQMLLYKEIITHHKHRRMRKVRCRCDCVPNINLKERYSRSWVPDWLKWTELTNPFILIYYSLFLIVSQTTNLFSALALYLAAKYFLCLNLSSVCFPYASDCQKTAPLRYVLYFVFCLLHHVGIWPNFRELTGILGFAYAVRLYLTNLLEVIEELWWCDFWGRLKRVNKEKPQWLLIHYQLSSYEVLKHQVLIQAAGTMKSSSQTILEFILNITWIWKDLL